MPKESWEEILLPPGNADHLWELFHENSKTTRYQRLPSNQEVAARMQELEESLPFEGYPRFELPNSLPQLGCALDRAILERSSPLALTPSKLSIPNLTALLRYAYGITRDNQGTHFPRPFRAVPSAGALYPLELFFYSVVVEGLPTGLYHFNPTNNTVRLLQEGDATQKIAQAVVQPEVPCGASVMIFITAVFERSIFKYGDRGYRFILLEAGHVAQNLNLVATALHLGCMNLGGFFDRSIDDILGLDGVTHSTVYIVAIGQKSATVS
jgi:SagB-type dehydrogenase family enzyme